MPRSPSPRSTKTPKLDAVLAHLDKLEHLLLQLLAVSQRQAQPTATLQALAHLEEMQVDRLKILYGSGGLFLNRMSQRLAQLAEQEADEHDDTLEQVMTAIEMGRKSGLVGKESHKPKASSKKSPANG
jgi:hypothetical protein